MPIFKIELIEKILAGLKRQTRRPDKASDYATYADDGSILAVYRNGRRLWEVGRDYALIPGRAKPAVEGYRIRITRIRQEDARDISHEDALAEGFPIAPKYDFLQVWTNFYDPKMGEWAVMTEYDPVQPNHCPFFLRERPAELYQCWALDFTLEKQP